MERFFIGTVLKPQGIKGELKAMLNIDAEELDEIGYVYIDNLDKKFVIEKIRYSGNIVYLKLSSINDRNQVELLRESRLYIDREELSVKDNEFVIDEVIGFILKTDSGEELGELVSVETFGAAPIFTINGKYGKSSFPCIEDVVKGFDYENRVILIDKKRFDEVRV